MKRTNVRCKLLPQKNNGDWKLQLQGPRNNQSPYSHLSNNHGGWNKRGGWDLLEKTST